MLAKFETKSPRVKGISFHPTRPWILCSLHDGQIQLWDYRVGTLLETYKEHKGPVRSVDFHSTQPLFVSGGDDYKIRVWNYNNKRSLFCLSGHKDYIRTVQFHSESPWIVSSSDDQTIRIWNWQSRECIAILQGHNHYVMCAQFHPTEDLVVSASLDMTIRVWDISGLKQKRSTTSTALGPVPVSMMNRLGIDNVCSVKYILEGHERGVNWASFHPELPLIVSGSDDRMIKIWRTNETKAWEIDTLRGHTNNVSSVLFHPREDLIISDSEDHSIRVWDSTKRVCIQSFVRTRDRFWILACHKQQNLLAAGHDSGTVVFKLSRERIPFTVFSHYCYYIKDHAYHCYDLRTKEDSILHHFTFGPGCNPSSCCMIYNTYNDSNGMILCLSKENQPSYELIQFSSTSKKQVEVISGTADSACFINRSKFVTLENNTLCFMNLDKQVTKRINLPIIGCQSIYESDQPGHILLVTLTDIINYDYQSNVILSQYTITDIKRFKWNTNHSYLAIVTKQGITILNKDFSLCCSQQENLRIKDCIWYNDSIVFYSTLSQVKYLLPSNEQGVVVSLDEPIYLIASKNTVLYGMNRQQKMVQIEINPTEFLFKYYLEQQQYQKAIHLLHKYQLDSKTILSYLHMHGFEDIALYFVNEPHARFNLAIRCGNLDIAMECASQLDESAIWNELAIEALRQGNHELVEMAYQHTKSFDKLSFLYVITGNTTKLEKMLKISELRDDVMGRYHNALLLGNIEARIQVLLDVQQYTLAYITAVTYGLTDLATSIRSYLEEEELAIPEVDYSHASLLVPPISVLQESNWPLLELPRSKFDKMMDEEMKRDIVNEKEEEHDVVEVKEENKIDDLSFSDDNEEEETFKDDLEFSENEEDANEDGWKDDDLEFSDESIESDIEDHNVPVCGHSDSSIWCNSSLAVDHIAAGSLSTAISLLNRQIAFVKPTTCISQFKQIYLANASQFIGYPSMPSLSKPFSRNSSKHTPFIPFTIDYIKQQMKRMLKAFQQAHFTECTALLETLFHEIPFVIVKNKSEESELRHYLDLAKEYMISMQLDNIKHDSHSTSERILDVTSFMTQCKLQTSHQLLTLHSAMVAAFKAGNFIDAASFAKLILQNAEITSPKNASLLQKAKKVLAKSEKEGRNAIQLEFNANQVCILDCCDFHPLKEGEKGIRCSYCNAVYKETKKGQVCSICKMAQIGIESVGLICLEMDN